MKRLILFLFAFLLAFPVQAGWNLKQNDDGTTSWVRDDEDFVQRSHDVGTIYLTVLLEDVGTASTAFVAVPVTQVRVKSIRTTVFGQLNSNALVDFFRFNSSGTLVGEITNGTTKMTLAATEGTPTDTDVFTPTAANINGHFEQNHIIAIHTDGNPAENLDAIFVIELVPR